MLSVLIFYLLSYDASYAETFLYKSLSHHSFSNSFESGDVSALYQSVLVAIVFFSCICASVEDVCHDLVKLFVNVFVLEYSVSSILTHFDT